MKKFLSLLAAVSLILSLSACIEVKNDKESDDTKGGTNTAEAVVEATNTDTTKTPEENNSKNENPTFGSTITFENMEITFGTEVTWTTLDNEFDENHGADVFTVPVTIKNIGNETGSLNMFFYKCFGTKGTELDSIGTYFDNDVFRLGDLRSGASAESSFNILYDGDGDYYIEFSNFSEKIEVKLPIAK